jgi:radical SAM protein with 4Fe4S-binding SPASM domain
MKAKVKSKLDLEERVALQDVIPLDTPFLLYVDPSSACNFRCDFCPTGHVDLLKASNYRRSVMPFALFEKLIADLAEFSRPIKVMRLNKIGEPTINKRLPEMVALAKKSGRVERVDFATNAALFSPDLLSRLVAAGLDRINISLEGMTREQYLEHAKVDIDFDGLVENIRWLYANRGDCEVTIKLPGNYVTEDQKRAFFDTFGDHCDRIFIEELAPIWPEFDVEQRAGIKIGEAGQYRQPAREKAVCAVIFYAMAVNADGTVSACCPDWDQKLIVGNAAEHSLRQIWDSPAMLELRRLHLSGKRFDNPVCRNCGHIKHAQVDDIDAHRHALLEKLTAGQPG